MIWILDILVAMIDFVYAAVRFDGEQRPGARTYGRGCLVFLIALAVVAAVVGLVLL